MQTELLNRKVRGRQAFKLGFRLDSWPKMRRFSGSQTGSQQRQALSHFEQRSAAFTLLSGLPGHGQRRPAMVGSLLGVKGSRVQILPSRLFFEYALAIWGAKEGAISHRHDSLTPVKRSPIR